MAAPVMRLTHEFWGPYVFPEESIPLMTRRVTAQRVGDQGGGHRRIDITLSGYVEGVDNSEVIERYEEIAHYLNGQRVKLYYFDGTRVVMDDQLVYFETLTEPEQWKQRLGDYAFSGYYFLEFVKSFNPVDVSFASQGGVGGDTSHSYAFKQIPIIAINSNPDRPSGMTRDSMPSGAALGAEVQMQLTGEITADTHAEVMAEKDLLEKAFSHQGTLSYGVVSFACQVQKIAWSAGVPVNYWGFQIDLVYYISGLMHFNAERTYSRMHKSPIIHENPACPNSPYVVDRYPEGIGQYITYHFEAEGQSLNVVRQLLLNEVVLLVHPDGHEIAGGNERHSWMTPKISIDFTRFHQTPVLQNIESIGSVIPPTNPPPEQLQSPAVNRRYKPKPQSKPQPEPQGAVT